MTQIAERLTRILAAAPLRLADVSDADASQPPAQGHWSKKEILGHLIDSASNNHQRIVRAQLAPSLQGPRHKGIVRVVPLFSLLAITSPMPGDGADNGAVWAG